MALCKKIFLIALVACVLRESCSTVWGPRDNDGQRNPQVFDLDANELLQDELIDVANLAKESRIQKRQQEELEDLDLSTRAILTNDSHLHAIVHWTGYPHENIFILTRNVVEGVSQESWLWRSTDYGATFVNETDKLNGSLIQLYYVSINTSYLIFADILNQTLQVSEDIGETFSTRPTPFTPNRILFQSKIAPNSVQFSKFVLGYDNAEEALWVTTDLGVSWTQIGSNVPLGRYYWRRLDSDIEGDLSTVYFEQRLSEGSNESMLYYSIYPYTEVQVFSPELGPFDSDSFLMAHEYMFVQISGSTLSSNVTYGSRLWVSYQRDRLFRQALFPLVSEELEHLHYYIYASEGEVLVAIYHNSTTAHLYISDVTGTSYSLSLDFIVSSEAEASGSKFDIHLVDGIRGAIVANRRVPGERFGKTFISHNKGGQWSPVQPPAIGFDGSPTSCFPPECSLHLRMETDIPSGYQSILSQDTAVGLIMASGNLGSSLASSVAFARVYLSRDGGFTWAEVESGRWEYQFLALGSIIVMVQKRALVNSFKWSCDEGATWVTDKLEDSMIARVAVIGMKTEIGEKPRFVSVFGLDYLQYIQNDFQFEWIVFTLNFTSVVSRQCDVEDYFAWVPTDERLSEGCLLGEVVEYERRNSTACCYVDPDYQKPTNASRCRCSLEDFECDLGFARETLNSPCTPVPGHVYPPPPPLLCPEGTNYTYSSGYRKIPGDKCNEEDINVDFLLPKTEPCPIRRAGGLSITFSPSIVTPGVPVSFTLFQSRGSKVSTTYMWHFNDSTPFLLGIGLLSAQSQQHTYDYPDTYYVSVHAINEDGVGRATVAVLVVDPLVGLTLETPLDQYNAFPIDYFVQFTAQVNTMYRTRTLSRDPFEVTWDFGDGSNATTGPQLAVGHLYERVGSYNVSISVSADVALVDTQTVLPIRTFKAPTSVNITSDSFIYREGRYFTEVGQSIELGVIPANNTEIPLNTVLNWQIQLPHQSKVVKTQGEYISYNFPVWGEYMVTVRGSYSRTGSLTGFINIYTLKDISVNFQSRPTIRTNQLNRLKLRLLDGRNSPYKGPINVTLETAAGSSLDTYTGIITGTSEITLSYTLKQPGSVSMKLKASNRLFNYTGSFKVAVVGSGEFGAVTILFDSGNLPSEYSTPVWQEKFSNSIADFVSTEFKISDQSLVEVESVSILANADSRKRSSDKFLAVNVNILPANYNSQDIGTAMKLVEQIVKNVADKNFRFNVDGDTLIADDAYDRNKEVIPIPGEVVDSPVATPLVDIVLGVVFTLLLVVIIIVVVVIVVVCYRKNRALQLKYSHLEETRGDGNLRFENEAFGDSINKENEKI